MARKLSGAPLLAIIAATYIVAVGITFLLTTDWLARQTWAVVFTGLAVIWYTWETSRLRDASLRQIEVGQNQVKASLEQVAIARDQLTAFTAQTSSQVRPFVIIHPEGSTVQLENIGVGPALNVR